MFLRIKMIFLFGFTCVCLLFVGGCNQIGVSASGAKSAQSNKSDSVTNVEPGRAQASKSDIVQRFDGTWWARAQSDERQGFLVGYLDCYVDDQHHALNFDKSWIQYESLVTKSYAESSSDKGRTVGQVIATFGHPDKNALKNPHADYGDEAWRQMMSQLTRLGFVKGYLACQKEQPGLLQWSQGPEYYETQLDIIYNYGDRPGAPEYGGSIASALAKLADKPKTEPQ